MGKRCDCEKTDLETLMDLHFSVSSGMTSLCTWNSWTDFIHSLRPLSLFWEKINKLWDVVALETPITLVTTACPLSARLRFVGPEKGRICTVEN
jgi:hypothetical protein